MDLTYEKKYEIINASIYLFSIKGYASTSVQDIASYCNISKATIYKFFASKEDILIDIIKHLNKQLAISVESIDSNTNLTKIEKFSEKIFIFLNDLSDKKEFSMMIFQNQSLNNKDKFKKVFLESKLFMLNWFKQILTETFEDEIKNITLDITFCLAALIKEFAHIFVIKQFIVKDLREVSNFIVSSIISLINTHKNKISLIPENSMHCFNMNFDSLLDKDFLLNEWNYMLSKIKAKIKDSLTIINRGELLGALDSLNEEYIKENPRSYMIDSLFLYISKYDEIINEVLLLKQIYNRM